ncbi:hypothetical protein [Variovorax paradoxus]|jgi:formylmethanofuran:tetrahydromethanopterin formyltransferase|uniref:HEAT repeat domain-containing protein n=1 Tax=Variovorax paradoxus TaxID=34073 RepID=A0A679JLK8_VARPD|nr:hypothetical protein VVAX_06394 [Variovorax paradoxus]
MTEAELLATQKQLSLDRERLEREKLEFEQKKMQRVTIAISMVALVVSLLQVAVAFMQSRLSTAQTVEKFIPHLQKPDTRDAALLTMAAFTDQEFVTQLAEKLKATTVLETLQAKGSDQDKARATEALSSLDVKRKQLLDRAFDDNKQTRIQATTELVRQWSNDPKVVPETIAAAGGKSGNASGVVNALVVLREAQPEALRANSAELVPFLDKVEANGPQTRALTAQVRERAGLPASAP